MELFKKIAENNISCNISVIPKDGQVTVLISPSGIKSNVKPLTVTGTPEELDEKFEEVLLSSIEKTKGLISNIEAHEKSVADAEKKTKEKKDDKKDKASTKVKPTSIKDKKDDKKDEDESDDEDESGVQESLL